MPVRVAGPQEGAHLRTMPTTFVLTEVDPESPEARWCLDQYYAELRVHFAEGFDPEQSVAADPNDFARPNGVFLVARLEGDPIGCGGVKRTSPEVGYIKRMWVSPAHRGAGHGRTLLRGLEEAAGGLGCRIVQLETNRSLKGAIRLYQTSGYREVEPFNDEYYAHHWFEKGLPSGP